MALNFDGTSSYIKFPNIRHTAALEPSVIAVLHRPTALDDSNHQYMFSQSNSAETSIGDTAFLINFNSADYRIFVGRDTLKFNTSTGSSVLWGQWNLSLVYNWGDITNSNNPRMLNGVFPYPSDSISFLSDSNTEGSGSYIAGSGNWSIGALGYNSSGHYQGDIEYVAVWSGVGDLGIGFHPLLKGISPLKIRTKFLKFFVKLSDPNNVIDTMSGRKAGIVGTIIPSIDSPRINY